jgi:hypothetical protein
MIERRKQMEEQEKLEKKLESIESQMIHLDKSLALLTENVQVMSSHKEKVYDIIQAALDRHGNQIFGNGKDGLVIRVDRLENWRAQIVAIWAVIASLVIEFLHRILRGSRV